MTAENDEIIVGFWPDYWDGDGQRLVNFWMEGNVVIRATFGYL